MMLVVTSFSFGIQTLVTSFSPLKYGSKQKKILAYEPQSAKLVCLSGYILIYMTITMKEKKLEEVFHVFYYRLIRLGALFFIY